MKTGHCKMHVFPNIKYNQEYDDEKNNDINDGSAI